MYQNNTDTTQGIYTRITRNDSLVPGLPVPTGGVSVFCHNTTYQVHDSINPKAYTEFCHKTKLMIYLIT